MRGLGLQSANVTRNETNLDNKCEGQMRFGLSATSSVFCAVPCSEQLRR